MMIESEHLIAAPRHRTRTAIYLAAMRAFAREVRALGFTVDYRFAQTFAQGLAAHRAAFHPEVIVMNHPRGRRATRLFTGLGVELLPDPFFLTDPEAFAQSVSGRPTLSMEHFYRSQRRRLGILMVGDEPVGGRWNYDEDNRKPLPRDGGTWPEVWSRPLDDDEQALVEHLGATHRGGDALAFWPRTRADALSQLHHALHNVLPTFGPFEDAASSGHWALSHTRLSVALNLGLLHPTEVIDGVLRAFDDGLVPIASAEGFLRQIIGWREWVWAWHRVLDDDYRSSNALSAHEPVPESWRSMGDHDMACLRAVLRHLHDYGWTHHIERLMVLANAATLAGINPVELNDWMAENFVDGAEWVMEANVLGMGTYADGGRISTKPYVSGGNYLKKMTNFCKGCAFSPTERTGPAACPLTNGYWNFLLDHAETLGSNYRLAPQLRAAQQRPDRVEIQREAQRCRSIILGRQSQSDTLVSQ